MIVSESAMKLFQMLVFSSVIFANIYWQITPNTYLACIIGFIAALLTTVAWINIADWLSRQKRRHQRAD